MKAFVLEQKGQAHVCECPEPELTDEYSAILTPVALSPCTSDVNTVYYSKTPRNGLILGHECVARIVKTGSKVRDFNVGDKVAVPAITPDYRHVDVGRSGAHAGKPFSGNALGRSVPGVCAEYFEVKDADRQLAKIPEGVSDEAALMCVDMMSTGFTGAEAAEIKPDDTVLVIGIGAVGLMAIAAAKLMGAGRIIAVGSRKSSVELALKYGADEVIDYKKDDYVEKTLSETGGRGADEVIICGGGDDVMARAIEAVRYGGGIVVNLKLFGGDGDISFGKFASGRGLGGKTIKMELCRGGREWTEKLLGFIEEGKIDPSRLITLKLEGFSNIEKALELMKDKSDDMIKVMVVPEWKEA